MLKRLDCDALRLALRMVARNGVLCSRISAISLSTGESGTGKAAMLMV